MITKLKLFFQLLHKGSEVADVEKWKKRQIQSAQIVFLLGVLVALAKAYGYDVPMSEADQASVGVALYAIINWVLTAVTSKRAGFEQKEVQPDDKANTDEVDPTELL